MMREGERQRERERERDWKERENEREGGMTKRYKKGGSMNG